MSVSQVILCRVTTAYMMKVHVESNGITCTIFMVMCRKMCCAVAAYRYRVSQEGCAILRESVPNVKLYRYNPKHLYPKLNGYGDNGQRSLKL